jgi:3-oxoacyl-[acyl-carrier protein] reductase
MSSGEAGVAIVTGGARGIGAAIAARLAQAGYRVLACDADWDEATVELGPAIAAHAVDVRDRAAVEAAVTAAGELGEVRALVNCAGVLRATRLDALDEDDLTLMWDVNVAGTARFCAAAVRACPRLAAIVNIGSISGRLGQLPGIALYGATKIGVESLTKALACELGPRGIRVNALAPGFIAVPMSSAMRAVSGGENGAVTHVPLGRMGRAEEIAEVTEFLLSPRASYVHGAVVIADGGACAR